MPGYRERSRRLVVAAVVLVACLPTACTRPSPPPDAPPTSSTSSISPSAVRAPDYAGMREQLEQQVTEGDWSLQAIRAVLVSVDGETVMSYYQDRRPTDRGHVWSVTKSVMSILVGIAVDEGRLRPDQTLAQLLPERAEEMTEEVRSITLRQLLTMTAGIQGGQAMVDTTTEDPVGAILRDALVAEPGAAFTYSNTSAHLVGAVLRRAVDRPLLEYAREKLFDPLGIDTRPAWQGPDVEAGLRGARFGWGTDQEGTHSGCCLLKLTAPDMLKIGQLYLDDGRWRGRQVVSAAWVRESTTDQLTEEQAPPEQSQGYGYLWWTGEVESHPYAMASGSYGQQILVVPDARLVVVTACDDSGTDRPTDAFWQTLADVVVLPILRS